MAQWNGQFSGLTHETKVEKIEASLRQAVTASDAATGAEREAKSKAVRHLSDRLLAARLKALRARLSALREPGQKRASDSQVKQLQTREQELHAQGVAGILKEFLFHESTVAIQALLSPPSPSSMSPQRSRRPSAVAELGAVGESTCDDC